MNTARLKRTNLLKVTLVAAVALLAACLLVLVGMERSAGAAFPGQNGKIAFTSTRDFNPEIYTMDADGSNQINFTNNPAHDQDPAWSPDSSKIAFDSDRDGPYTEIYSMNTDGSDVARLTNSPRFDLDADWGTAPAVEDSTQPTLSLPGDIIVNATTADGAQVTFEVSATDETDPIPPVVSCDPVSGSTFPIGTTTVTCTATDNAGNTARGSFDVIVQGATEQVTNLKDEIANLNLPAGTNTSLSATLQQAQSSIEADNVTAALEQLDAFVYQVKAQEQRGKLSSQEAADLISSAEQIKVVLGG